MTRQEKIQIVKTLSEAFKSSDAVVVCEYKGLKVPQLEILRSNAREQGVKVQVVKNTLANIAFKEANIDGFELKDTNIFIWGDDQLSVAKIVANFAKSNAIFTIKSAYIGGAISDAAQVEVLSKMPSRDELIAMLLQVWKAPIANFTIGLDALRAKKEESA
ncbi:MAG: 50S ribosomal protein L10 [Campylobacteraceae bacterium]|nr:50S ribosomal protein L10 [Campylobacteraceae bacterium]